MNYAESSTEDEKESDRITYDPFLDLRGRKSLDEETGQETVREKYNAQYVTKSLILEEQCITGGSGLHNSDTVVDLTNQHSSITTSSRSPSTKNKVLDEPDKGKYIQNPESRIQKSNDYPSIDITTLLKYNMYY